jgi:HEAT repeat protein
MTTKIQPGDYRDNLIHTLQQVLDRDNSLSRCCAVKALARLDACDDESTKRLMGMLLDQDPDVRIDAATALGRLGVEEAAEPLLKNIEGDPEGGVRIEAVRALSKIKSTRAVEPLIRCFQEDGYPQLDNLVDDLEFNACWEVQSQSIDALGEIGDPRTVEPLMALLEEEGYEDLQENGFRVLARLSGDKARAFLLKQLQEGNVLARRRAAKALIGLPGLRDEGEGVSPEILDALTNALVDPEPNVRIYAAQVLGATRNPMVTVPLTLLLNDPDMEVRSEVAKLLGKVRGKKIAERLHQLLEDPEQELKRQVVQVLGDIGDPASLEPLSRLLDSQDGKLVYEVVIALGKIAVPGPENKLARILADKKTHYTSRIQAAQALGPILRNAKTRQEDASGENTAARREEEVAQPRPTPQEVLEEAVFDEDERVGYAALNSLVAMDPEHAVGRLAVLLGGEPRPAGAELQHEPEAGEESPVAGVQPEASGDASGAEIPHELEDLIAGHDAQTSTLASMLANQVPVSALAEAMDEPPRGFPGKTVRILAARLLGNISSPEPPAVDVLIQACAGEDPELRREAIRSLGRIGDEKALPVILEGLEAEQEFIRMAALVASGQFTGVPDANERITKLLDDPDAAIRQKVVQTLDSQKGPAVAEYLLQALEDEDLGVCRAALNALSEEIYDEEHGKRIEELMFKFSAGLRQEAAATLRRMHDYSSTSALLERLRDMGQEEFHWICIEALAELYAGEEGKLAA